MSKMFVHFNGTVEAFKSAGHETTYSNHIVFIKGGTDGKGAAVYTHGNYYGDVKDALAALQTKVDGMKYFSKISDGTNTASVNSADGTIQFSATDPSEVKVGVDATGVTIGLSEAFKTAVNSTLPGNISAVDAKLGAKDAVAATGESASAFGRIKNLETIVAGLTGSEGGEVESVDAKIIKAIEALDVNEISGDYIKSVKQVDGKIEATVGTFNFDAAGSAASALAEAKTYAEGQATAAKDAAIAASDSKGSAAQALTDAKAYTVEVRDALIEAYGAADAQVLVDAKAYADGLAGNYDEEGAAAAVQGNLDTEILRAKAAEEANAAAIKTEKERMDAFMLSAEVGEAAVDTLKEIQAYITSDGTAAAKMAEDIAAAQAAADKAQGEVDALEGVVASEVERAEAKEAELLGAINTEKGRAEAAEKANADAITALTKTHNDDVAALNELISGEAERADAAEKANAAAIEAISKDYLKAADKTALEGQISAEATARSEKDAELEGKITTLEGLAGSESVASVKAELEGKINEKVSTTTHNQAVQDLTNMWAWEEL